MENIIFKIALINALGKKGSEKTPDMLLERLEDVKERCDVIDINIDNNNIKDSVKDIENNVNDGKNNRKIFLGGDHSVTYPILKGLFGQDMEGNKRNNFLIVFDAHADCDFCNKEPTHEEWLRAVVEQGVVKPENIILIGLRRYWNNEKKFLDERGIKYFSCGIGEKGLVNLEGIGDYVTEKANAFDIDNVYVSIDMDVFEPCVAPGVHYPEFSGLLSRDFFYLFDRILRLPRLRAMDLVEIVPDKDEKHDFRTVDLGAEIVRRFVKYV